jgi:DNA repair exonuclease SbcCD ATPase subunit
MQSVWSEIYPYADYNGIRFEVGNDDYRLEASTSMADGTSAWTEVDGMASGGERSMACLAMRIALAMVTVPNLKWLILDEPTHNIDENGIAKFIDMLGNSLPKVVEQVFVITHDNELKQISSARIYQLERDKDRNGYTNVVEL